jgi:hypothetical protein
LSGFGDLALDIEMKDELAPAARSSFSRRQLAFRMRAAPLPAKP